MCNCCISLDRSNRFQEFKSINRFKAEILEQLLRNIKIERSMTFDQSNVAIMNQEAAWPSTGFLIIAIPTLITHINQKRSE